VVWLRAHIDFITSTAASISETALNCMMLRYSNGDLEVSCPSSVRTAAACLITFTIRRSAGPLLKWHARMVYRR
jgi:hypothetical protein